MAALLIYSKNFCGDGSHFASLSTSDFAGCHPSSKIRAHGKAPEEEREFGIFAPVADEVEFILKAPAPTDLLRPQRAALHKPGFLIVDRRGQPIPL